MGTKIESSEMENRSVKKRILNLKVSSGGGFTRAVRVVAITKITCCEGGGRAGGFGLLFFIYSPTEGSSSNCLFRYLNKNAQMFTPNSCNFPSSAKLLFRAHPINFQFGWATFCV